MTSPLKHWPTESASATHTAPHTTRRALLQSAGATLLIAACDTSPRPPETDDNADAGREAPALTGLVEAGELPPVEERLPDTPMTVEPFDRPGVYGGTWNSAILGPADRAILRVTIGYEPLLRWNLEWTQAIPNVASAVEASPDGSTFTIHLRPGMRWSDGEPYTADDIVFWYEDVLNNDKMDRQNVPSFLIVDGEPPVFEKVDDNTVQIHFAGPNGLLLEHLPTPDGNTLIGRPRHYLEQFHPDYNPDANQLAADEGAADWVELIDNKAGDDLWHNPDLPTLNAWMLTTALGGGDRVVADRNPYYWKIDSEGRQLPYLDQVAFQVTNDEEVVLLMGLSGELDMYERHVNTQVNKPLFAQDRATGDFDFFDYIGAGMNTVALALNLTHKDDVKREIFQNKDFRIGLSHAIDREEIINTVYQRQGEPWQLAPRPESDFYDEEYAKQFTEFDLGLANTYLDQAGYSERDSDGYRLGPDGERISFSIDVTADQRDRIDTLELIQGYWDEVGVQVQVSAIDRSLFYTRKEANDHDANVWSGGAGMRDAYVDPRWYMPNGSEANYAIPWAAWYITGGDESGIAEEPPEATRRQMELYNELRSTLDDEERASLLRQILEIGKEEFYAIGISLPAVGYGIVKNNFHNVPPAMPYSWQQAGPGPSNPEQYFIQD